MGRLVFMDTTVNHLRKRKKSEDVSTVVLSKELVFLAKRGYFIEHKHDKQD